MNIDPVDLEAWTKVTWKALRPGPESNYEALMSHESGQTIIKAHQDFIRCLLANDFDPRRATKIFSKGQGTFDELEESGKEFREKLAKMLRELVKLRNKCM